MDHCQKQKPDCLMGRAPQLGCNSTLLGFSGAGLPQVWNAAGAQGRLTNGEGFEISPRHPSQCGTNSPSSHLCGEQPHPKLSLGLLLPPYCPHPVGREKQKTQVPSLCLLRFLT